MKKELLDTNGNFLQIYTVYNIVGNHDDFCHNFLLTEIEDDYIRGMLFRSDGKFGCLAEFSRINSNLKFPELSRIGYAYQMNWYKTDKQFQLMLLEIPS